MNATGFASQPKRGSTIGIIFLLIIVAIFLVAKIMLGRNEQSAKTKVLAAQSDPQTTVEEFFLQCSLEQAFKDNKWPLLLEFMSRDDREWFQQNCLRLSSMNPQTEGMVSLAITEPERRYSALKYLLKFGPGSSRPVLAQIKQQGNHAVAYVHEANQAQTMEEVFLVQEAGQWKIRRFLGMRDNPSLLSTLVQDKVFSDKPLTPDEQRFKADPATFAEFKRAELLKEVGLTPPPPTAKR